MQSRNSKALVLARRAKLAFYTVTEPLTWLNGIFYRSIRASRTGVVKAHLGPGQKRYLSGWVNVDANTITAKCDIWADLRHKLPFRDNAVDAIYSHHVVEHLPNLQFHFDELYRCLKPGGVFRIGGPNGDCAIQKFSEGDLEWFGEFPDKRSSLGGRFENFIFCRQEHLTILTLSYLQELSQNAGFPEVKQVLPASKTLYPDYFDQAIFDLEHENSPDCPHTLIVEGQKPVETDGG